MSHAKHTQVVLVFLLAASLACSLGGGSGQPTAPASPDAGEPASNAGPAPTEVPPGEFLELEPPPPAGLMEALEARVEAGDWSYEDSLSNGLKLFTGEAQPSDLFSEAPAFFEGFGLVREAQRYVREGEDPAVRQQLAENLDRMGPTSERLLEYADPAPSASRRPGLAAQSSVGEECATLFDDYATKGFPPGSGIKCLLYKEGGIGGQTIRVYWPIAYMTETDYADAAYTGVIKAWQEFSKLTPSGAPAQMKGVDLLFMILPNVEHPEVLAMVPSASADDRCLIMVYLGAIQANEQEKSAEGDYGHFLQTIAHEMFHCFQVWNFSSQADDTWAVQDWWGEGTADYFSNVVWPEVNDEYGFLSQAAYNSAYAPIVEMSYDNFLFFQFFANQRGNQALLDLIKKLPTGVGVEAHAAALAQHVPDIQTLFHDFGRAYIDGKIKDTSNALIPTLPPYIRPDHRIEVNETQIRQLDASPFVLTRYAITFPKGWRYTAEKKPAGSGAGLDAARIDFAGSPWGNLPPQVDAGCAPVTYWVLLTNAAPPTPYSIEVTLIPKEALGCDECLIGTWDINIPSFIEYSEAPFVDTPELYQFNTAGGLWRYHFRADSTMSAEFDFFYSYRINQKNEPLGNDITIDATLTIEGTGNGTYASDSLSNLTFAMADDSVVFSQEMYMNGEKMAEGPIDPSAFSGFGSGTSTSAIYSCDDEAGELLLNTAPSTGLPPILFNRVSKQP